MSLMWSDERVENALAALASTLDVPPPSRLVTSPTSPTPPAVRPVRWRGGRARRALAVAAAVLIATTAAVALWPEARRAVAGWFGFGSVVVERVSDDVDDPRPLGRFVDDVTPLALPDALTGVPVAVERLGATTLGPPVAAGEPPEGGVVVRWADGTTLWALPSGADRNTKLIAPGDDARQVEDLGDFALSLEGHHVLATPVRQVIANTVVWWLDDSGEYRLESDRPAAELVELARTLAAEG